MSNRDRSHRLEFECSEDSATLHCIGPLRSEAPADDARRGVDVCDRHHGNEQPGKLAIDLTRITEFDTSGVVLLLHLAAQFRHRGCECELQGTSSRLEGVLRLLGVEAEVGLPENPNASPSSVTGATA
jgi:ABC-type transporter Mla MlaB component